MNVTHQLQDNVCRITVTGRLDVETTQAFQEYLNARIDEGHLQLIIDVNSLEYISSVGLRAFLATLKKIRPLGGTIRLAGLHDSIQDVFEISGFLTLFPSAD